MTVCVTGATGFIGGHVAKLETERGAVVRATYRDEARLERLRGLEGLEPVKADVLDRTAMRRAVKGCETLFHTAGFVGSKPADLVWRMNALAPRIAVEAAAAEGVRRVVLASSVAAIGPLPRGEVGDEEQVFRGSGVGFTYAEAKHEGELEALAAAARHGVELVIVNPSYVFGVPVDRSQPGETSTRTVGNYLRGRLPAVVDGRIDAVDVRDVASGHVKAADRGKPGERYILGGHEVGWVELVDRLAELSGVRHPLLVIPPEAAAVARAAESLRLPSPVSPEALVLMAQNWAYSSRKARRELGHRSRALDSTLRDTIEWYRELIEAGRLDGGGPSAFSVSAAGMRLAGRAGLVGGLQRAERYLGRRLVGGA